MIFRASHIWVWEGTGQTWANSCLMNEKGRSQNSVNVHVKWRYFKAHKKAVENLKVWWKNLKVWWCSSEFTTFHHLFFGATPKCGNIIQFSVAGCCVHSRNLLCLPVGFVAWPWILGTWNVPSTFLLWRGRSNLPEGVGFSRIRPWTFVSQHQKRVMPRKCRHCWGLT